MASSIKSQVEMYVAYDGPELPENICRLNINIKKVDKVVMGESHLLVQCYNQE